MGKEVKPKLILIHLVVELGDVITSEKGIRAKSKLTGNKYMVKKLKVCESGGFEALEKKIDPECLDYTAVRKELESYD